MLGKGIVIMTVSAVDLSFVEETIVGLLSLGGLLIVARQMEVITLSFIILKNSFL